MSNGLVGGRKAAELLGVGPDTFYRLVGSGEIQPIEVDGGHPVYRRSDVDALAAKRAADLRDRAAAIDPGSRAA